MTLKIKRMSAGDWEPLLKLLVLGTPGAGKTRFSATGPNTLFAVAEGGLLSVRDKDIRYADISGSEDLRQLGMALDQEQKVREKYFGFPIETVVVDTFDEVARIIQRERLLDKRQETFTQADWGWFGDQLRASLRLFRNLDLNVIITCHVSESKDEVSGQISMRPQIQGGVRDELASYFDEVFLIRANVRTAIKDGVATREVYRILQTIQDSQYEFLKDRSGTLPPEVELNLQDDFARLRHAIFGKAAVTPTPKVSKAEQEKRAAPASPTAEAAPGSAPPPASETAPEPAAAEAASDPPVDSTTVESPAAPEAVSEATPGPAPAQLPPAPEPAAPAESSQPTGAHAAGESPPETEPSASEPAPGVPQPPAEPSAPAPSGSDDAPPAEDMTCTVCGGPIESKDQSELSRIRFRKALCVKCFKDAGKKKTGTAAK